MTLNNSLKETKNNSIKTKSVVGLNDRIRSNDEYPNMVDTGTMTLKDMNTKSHNDVDISGLESLNKYKKEIELFGLLMKSPELFIDTGDKENDRIIGDSSFKDKSKIKGEKTFEDIKKSKQDKLFAKFGDSFKTFEDFINSNIYKMHNYLEKDEEFKSVMKDKN